MNALAPKKIRYRKHQVGVIRGLATSGSKISTGDYGIKVLRAGKIKPNQFEAARVAARKATKKVGKIIFKVCCNKPISQKPLEVRMGKGKASPSFNAAIVKPGAIVMELMGVSEKVAFDAFRRASHKLPLPTALVERWRLTCE